MDLNRSANADSPGEEENAKLLEIEGEVPLPEEGGLDDAFLQAQDLMNSFTKTIKAFRLYPPENPVLIGLREQFFRKVQDFLREYHYFVLEVGEYELSFRGKVLYRNPDLKSSLAFLLYKDGLREIRFMEGIEEWEVEAILEIVKRGDLINQLEDDLVTLMWEKDFIHISYRATEAFLEDMPVLIPQDVEQLRKNMFFEPPPASAQDDRWEEEEEAGVDYYDLLSREDLARVPAIPTNRNVYFLTPEQMETLHKEVDAETTPGSVFNVLDILFEILALEKETDPYTDACQLLLRLMDALITVGDFQRSAELLTRLKIVVQTYDLKEWQVTILSQILDHAGDPPRVEKIGKVLEKGEGVKLEEANRYLLLLKSNSIQPLIRVLGELSNSKARRMLCDVLCEIGRSHFELFPPFVDDPRWFLVRNIAYILGRLGKEACVPALQKCVQHKEVRVRREAVQSLGLIGGPRAFELLRKALQDADTRIRSLAALNLARVGKEAVLPFLLSLVQAKDFSKKEPAEIKAFFDAIGMVGSNEATGVLQKVLEQRSWFGGGKKEEMRQGAAGALALIRTAEARAILEAGRNSRDENIRQACLQALRRQNLPGDSRAG